MLLGHQAMNSLFFLWCVCLKFGIMLLKCLGFIHSKDTNASEGQYPTVIEELSHHFSLADLRKSTNNFDENQIIGRGGFGKVYKGCLQHNGVGDYTVALKRWDMNTLAENQEYFKKEVELLCQLRHPNMVSLIGFCNDKHEKIIVYEYMLNGSFHDHLRNKDMEPLSWKKRLEICIGAACGVHYLHTGAKRTIIHRFINPSNILLDSNMVPKLKYFGLSLQGPLFPSKPKLIKTEEVAGTIGFLAPENFNKPMPGLTDRSDVYSFGVFLLEVVCRESYTTILGEILRELPSEELDMPIISDGASVPNIMQRLTVEENIDPTLAGKIAPECWKVFIDIIDRCLKYEPNERPAMGEVEVELEHALSLQQEADANNTSGEYSFLSTSISQPQQLQEEAPISA
ncbi:receptor-like protein kinase ANXUR2 isoform X2 [Gastrolobium bilobum]|nr:receptor-like protein kinase ANXUR2 isoform X2 [Gastrolobium bilobum]